MLLPNSDDEEDGDWQMDADDLRDYLGQDIIPPPRAPATGPYASFLVNMPGWINMTQDKYTKSWEALPLPAVGQYSPPSPMSHYFGSLNESESACPLLSDLSD